MEARTALCVKCVPSSTEEGGLDTEGQDEAQRGNGNEHGRTQTHALTLSESESERERERESGALLPCGAHSD